MHRHWGYNFNAKDWISAYRADPKGKYGGKDGMETLPKRFQRSWLKSYLSAFAVGKKYGAPTEVTPEDLYALLMKEGREDFGTNEYDKNNPKSHDIWEKTFKDLRRSGMSVGEAHSAAMFPAALYDHWERAKRKGITPGHSWTGLGRSVLGITGKEAGEMMEQQYAGSDYEKNQELMNFIRKWGGFAETPKEAEVKPEVEQVSSAGIDQSIDQTKQTLTNLSAMRAKEQPSAPMPNVPQEKAVQSPMPTMERSAS